MIVKKTLHFLILSVFSCFLHRSPFCKDIVSCRGDHVRLAVRVRVFTYPENACAVWLMFACKYCSVLWSTDTCISKLQACHRAICCIFRWTRLLSSYFARDTSRNKDFWLFWVTDSCFLEWESGAVFFSNVILAGFSTTRRAILFH